ncbi:MAG TPA: TetR/AcrR family transcriptional regulator [Candidatus Aquilonibacter sp.]
MPRAYRSGQRKAAADETRARIVAGARDLLLSDDGYRHFTMDAIAKHTNVARMTVYYQFQSKTGLFEALADDLAARGGIRENATRAFSDPDPRTGLRLLIDAFVHFWLAEPDVMRKLNALSMLDADSRAAERDSWRREAIDTMLARLKKRYRLSTATIRKTTDALYMLTAFGPCDALAREGRSERTIAARICELAGDAAGLDLTN